METSTSLPVAGVDTSTSLPTSLPLAGFETRTSLPVGQLETRTSQTTVSAISNGPKIPVIACESSMPIAMTYDNLFDKIPKIKTCQKWYNAKVELENSFIKMQVSPGKAKGFTGSITTRFPAGLEPGSDWSSLKEGGSVCLQPTPVSLLKGTFQDVTQIGEATAGQELSPSGCDALSLTASQDHVEIPSQPHAASGQASLIQNGSSQSLDPVTGHLTDHTEEMLCSLTACCNTDIDDDIIPCSQNVGVRDTPTSLNQTDKIGDYENTGMEVGNFSEEQINIAMPAPTATLHVLFVEPDSHNDLYDIDPSSDNAADDPDYVTKASSDTALQSDHDIQDRTYIKRKKCTRTRAKQPMPEDGAREAALGQNQPERTKDNLNHHSLDKFMNNDIPCSQYPAKKTTDAGIDDLSGSEQDLSDEDPDYRPDSEYSFSSDFQGNLTDIEDLADDYFEPSQNETREKKKKHGLCEGETSSTCVTMEPKSKRAKIQEKESKKQNEKGGIQFAVYGEAESSMEFGLFPKKKKKVGCKQVYDKTNFCTFCGTAIRSKIHRHLLTVHKDEPRVARILFMEKRSKERIVHLELLANEGNFTHNIEVLRSKQSRLVVARRSGDEKEHKTGDFLPCQYCKNFIMLRNLWFHHKTCSMLAFIKNKIDKNSNEFANPEEQEEESQTHCNSVRMGRSLLKSALLHDESPLVATMLSRMRRDDITEIVENDTLIKRYAALKMEELGDASDQKLGDIHRVSQKARTLARLVIQAREEKACVSLDKLITPENFDLVVSSTKKMSYEKDEPALTLGRMIGNLINQSIVVKYGLAGRIRDDAKRDEANRFQELFKSEWNGRVNARGVKKLNKLHRTKVQSIPLTKDLVCLRDYILGEVKKKSDSLKNEEKTPKSEWVDLAKLTMSRLILFNKRRRAEVKDLTVNDYENRPCWKDDISGEWNLALSETDKLLANRMDMVVAAGKSRKNVEAFVIIPPDAKDAIELLLHTRKQVGILTSNEYLFPRPNAETPFSGHTELKEIVQACPGIEHPERISSRSLRKYIATVSQILDMNDNEVSQLATHLGHDVKTHKEYYRLQHSTIELSKVSQLLIAVEDGDLNKFKGRGLSEISLDDLTLDAEQSDCESVEEDVDPEPPDTTYIRSSSTWEVPQEALQGVSEEEVPQEVSQEEVPQEVPQEVPRKEKSRKRVAEEGKSEEPVRKRRVPWRDTEIEALQKTFGKYFRGRESSTIHNVDILEAQTKYPVLKRRTFAQIRTQLSNLRKKS